MAAMAVEAEPSSSASSTSPTTTVATTDTLSDGNEGDYYQVRPVHRSEMRVAFVVRQDASSKSAGGGGVLVSGGAGRARSLLQLKRRFKMRLLLCSIL